MASFAPGAAMAPHAHKRWIPADSVENLKISGFFLWGAAMVIVGLLLLRAGNRETLDEAAAR